MVGMPMGETVLVLVAQQSYVVRHLQSVTVLSCKCFTTSVLLEQDKGCGICLATLCCLSRAMEHQIVTDPRAPPTPFPPLNAARFSQPRFLETSITYMRVRVCHVLKFWSVLCSLTPTSLPPTTSACDCWEAMHSREVLQMLQRWNLALLQIVYVV